MMLVPGHLRSSFSNAIHHSLLGLGPTPSISCFGATNALDQRSFSQPSNPHNGPYAHAHARQRSRVLHLNQPHHHTRRDKCSLNTPRQHHHHRHPYLLADNCARFKWLYTSRQLRSSMELLSQLRRRGSSHGDLCGTTSGAYLASHCISQGPCVPLITPLYR